MGELDDQYAEGIEKENELFLEGLQNKRSLREMEREYSQKVKEIRRIYEKSLKKDLNEEKEKEIEKIRNKKKPKEKEEKEFHVRGIELEKNWKEKKRIEVKSWGYRTKRKVKNFIQRAIPNKMIYLHYKTKRILKDFFGDIWEFLSRIFRKVSKRIVNEFSLIKDGFIKMFSDIKNIIKKFRSKKKKGEKNGKTEKNGKEKDDSAKNTNKKPEKQNK